MCHTLQRILCFCAVYSVYVKCICVVYLYRMCTLQCSEYAKVPCWQFHVPWCSMLAASLWEQSSRFTVHDPCYYCLTSDLQSSTLPSCLRRPSLGIGYILGPSWPQCLIFGHSFRKNWDAKEDASVAMSMSMLIEITCTTSHRTFNLSLGTLTKNARHPPMPEWNLDTVEHQDRFSCFKWKWPKRWTCMFFKAMANKKHLFKIPPCFSRTS